MGEHDDAARHREDFAAEIRAKRKGMRLTQQELAERAGVSRKTVVNIEAGRVIPQQGSLALILEALNYQGQGERPWDDDVDAFLQMVGYRLARLSAEERVAMIDRITRIVIFGIDAPMS